MNFFFVTVPPKLAPLPTNEPLYPGDFFQLTCNVVHGDSPYNITWYFNDEPVGHIDGVNIMWASKRTSLLNIDSVRDIHDGNYTCVGSNSAGQSRVTSVLSVKGSFRISFVKHFNIKNLYLVIGGNNLCYSN